LVLAALVLALPGAAFAQLAPGVGPPRAPLFDTSHLPREGFGTVGFAFRRWLTLNGNRAFVLVGNDAAVYTSDQPTAAAAEAEAMQLCARRNEGACRLYATNWELKLPGAPAMVALPASPAIEGAGWRAHPAATHWRWGPERAAGVVLWLHGYGGLVTDLRGGPLPSLLNRFVIAGYDLWRLDREPAADGFPTRSRAQLTEAVARLRRLGYRQLIAAGHSYGGWVSLDGLMAGLPIDGVLATSPARHGRMDDGWADRRIAARDDYLDVVQSLAPTTASLAIVLPTDDPWDPELAWRRSTAEAWFTRRPGSTVVVTPPGDHGAVFGTAVNDRYGACVLATMVAREQGLVKC
jgi:pimeloyl-ACP methyl ester carboxylesterase